MNIYAGVAMASSPFGAFMAQPYSVLSPDEDGAINHGRKLAAEWFPTERGYRDHHALIVVVTDYQVLTAYEALVANASGR